MTDSTTMVIFGASGDLNRRKLIPALFMRADSTELAWQLIDPILSAWRLPQAQPLIEYAAGSWGPTEADDLIARSGMEWLQGCGLH